MTPPPAKSSYPVPWAVRLSSESPRRLERLELAQIAPGQAGAGEYVIIKADAHKDERGIWWVPENEPDGGAPQFSQMSAQRQRRCFDERRCQVCGQEFGNSKLTWIVERRNLPTAVTSHAPVCHTCIPTALSLCPHWKRTPPAILETDDWKVVGIYGDVIEVRDGEVIPTETTTVLVSDVRILRTFAKQLVVELENWVEIQP